MAEQKESIKDFGDKGWDDLSLAEQDEFLLSIIEGEEAWTKVMKQTNLQWIIANSLVAYICPNGAVPKDKAERESRIEEAIKEMAETKLCLRFKRAIARSKGEATEGAEPDLQFVAPPPKEEGEKCEDEGCGEGVQKTPMEEAGPAFSGDENDPMVQFNAEISKWPIEQAQSALLLIKGIIESDDEAIERCHQELSAVEISIVEEVLHKMTGGREN
ncbi:MAG: hypothetical protein KAT46_03625 [Deltaproteobacteria bacterium]|nr:hypothetical protein [Deltaproteobacteria bacterium]